MIDPEAREVWLGGEPIALTPIEFDLLDALASRPRTEFTRAQLIERVWGRGWCGDERLVDIHLGHVRRKLGDDVADPRYVRTGRGAVTESAPGKGTGSSPSCSSVLRWRREWALCRARRFPTRRGGAGALFEVTDTGEGFDPSYAERVFERLYRTDSSRTWTSAGSGVGLTIARAIVEAHDGTLTATREAPGKGATFWIRRPGTVQSRRGEL